MNNSWQILYTVLQQELAQLSQMETVLGREQEALKRHDADALGACASEKQRLVESLASLGQQMQSQLATHGFSEDPEGLKTFLERDPQGRLTQVWADVEASLKRCETLNQVNGVLLESGRKSTQQLLNILLGGGAPATELYNSSGSISTSLPNSQGKSFKV